MCVWRCRLICFQSPDEEVSYASLRQENDDLLKRLADVQEQKWILEEKVMICCILC